MDASPQSPVARSHHSRSFSFRSDKSAADRAKDDHESPREKQRRDSIWKQNSKANPNAALTEAQPGVNAIYEDTTLSPLRGYQHRDAFGNVITDPDLSNPTRPRMERPLDTIRSFEAAIDSGYKRRSTYSRADSFDTASAQGNRRTSAYGYESGPPPARFSNYNGGGYYSGPSPVRGPQRYGPPRMQSDPYMAQKPYHGQQPSQDTVHTGGTNGSDSTGPWASGTDPSSENSSIDKNYPPPTTHTPTGYGPKGFGGIPEEGGVYPSSSSSHTGYGAPPVQPSPQNAQRRPIPLGNSTTPSSGGGQLPSQMRSEPEKRKSWLKRRFSKKD